MLQASGNPGLSSGNNDFMENIEDTDHPEVLANEGIHDVSTWAARNPGAHIIQPRCSRQISEAQKASWAIARQQRAAKKALLDNAVQEYLMQQTSKLEEIASKHSITVEYLKGLIGGQMHYHNPRKVQRHNVLLHTKALEVNTDRPSGTKYSLTEIQKMVKDDERLQNLMQEELEQHITTLNEHRDTKIHGIRANNEVYSFFSLTSLHDHTGIYAMLLVTRGYINDSIQSMWTTTNNSTEFWEDIFGHQIVDIARQYEQWACTQNQNLLECDSLGSLRKQITKAISLGLERITNKKHIVMNYHSYETAIIKTGTCFWEKLSKSELDLFTTELNARCAAGETIQNPQKKHLDAGIPQKRKAPIGGKENVWPQKIACSTHKHALQKSTAFIPTSDEEDSDEDA
ncbi:hypothetical protein PISMIDRAFT_12179 [Pisolithus microcarpus 441]|uniref:Uncharacterized protein n=1 Tax=Pisolithus microcarpus 441 TaxID=765257 RepID=A0A0C9ZP79_9AGAM|nr:hypothetical protein PISMIDRAFT_12179 [Pisolithus microcarpus 441]